MKKVLSIFGAAIISLALAGCNQGSEESSNSDGDHDHPHGPNGEHEVVGTPALEGDEKVAVDAYPIDFCVVSGEKLGSMGDPTVLTEGGQTVKLCCKDCLDSFKSDTEKYLTKLTEAVAQAKAKTIPTPPMPE